MKTYKPFIIALSLALSTFAANAKTYSLQSPDKKIGVTIDVADKITWSVVHGADQMLAPSELALTVNAGEVLGEKPQVTKTVNQTIDTKITAQFYKKKEITNQYNQLTISFKGNWGLVFRAYNDGVAYRFVLNRKQEQTVVSENANFNFDADYNCFVPYVCDLRDPKDQFCSAFESLYDQKRISQLKNDSLSLTPLLVEAKKGKKIALLEADLQDYPGMFLTVNKATRKGFVGEFAPYPTEEKIGGFAKLNLMPTKRANYIAKVNGTHQFPWRVAVISGSDKELLNNDMVYKLSTSSKITDTSWIKAGKVAWDWWNNWNITSVDFKAGVNTETYKYYIDFASKNKIEYIVMDEGWSVSAVEPMKISPNIQLQELIDYGRAKNVDIILWASWRGIYPVVDKAFAKYAAMGIKGFKIDFIDRDDQKMVRSCYEIAEKAAKYKLVLDYHGMFKSAGMNVTYPNVLNFEGVRGLENCKWHNYDAPLYDVTMPFIRMLAGPIDYTPGAMRNAAKSCFRPVNDNPMSQGTRCHQMAMYVAYEAPLQMLADNPTAYMKEQECADFIAKVPTVFDETIALAGKVGSYLAIARRSGKTWFVGALTNWNAQKITIDFSFLPEGNYEAEVFSDGVNAARNGTDYKKQKLNITNKTVLNYTMAEGGGLAISLTVNN
jgi:alpha-glucosidase